MPDQSQGIPGHVRLWVHSYPGMFVSTRRRLGRIGLAFNGITMESWLVYVNSIVRQISSSHEHDRRVVVELMLKLSPGALG